MAEPDGAAPAVAQLPLVALAEMRFADPGNEVAAPHGISLEPGCHLDSDNWPGLVLQVRPRRR